MVGQTRLRCRSDNPKRKWPSQLGPSDPNSGSRWVPAGRCGFQVARRCRPARWRALRVFRRRRQAARRRCHGAVGSALCKKCLGKMAAGRVSYGEPGKRRPGNGIRVSAHVTDSSPDHVPRRIPASRPVPNHMEP